MPSGTVIYSRAGQKFPSKTLEMSLQASISFPEHHTPTGGEAEDDPFCVGLNAYADVRERSSVP